MKRTSSNISTQQNPWRSVKTFRCAFFKSMMDLHLFDQKLRRIIVVEPVISVISCRGTLQPDRDSAQAFQARRDSISHGKRSSIAGVCCRYNGTANSQGAILAHRHLERIIRWEILGLNRHAGIFYDTHNAKSWYARITWGGSGCRSWRGCRGRRRVVVKPVVRIIA